METLLLSMELIISPCPKWELDVVFCLFSVGGFEWPGPDPLSHTGLTLSSDGPSGAELQVASACLEELDNIYSFSPITTLYLSLSLVLKDDSKYISTLFMPISFHRGKLSVRYLWAKGICFDICFSIYLSEVRHIVRNKPLSELYFWKDIIAKCGMHQRCGNGGHFWLFGRFLKFLKSSHVVDKVYLLIPYPHFLSLTFILILYRI